MYLYRPEWVYLVRGWAALLSATTAITWLLATFTALLTVGFIPGLVAHPLLVWLLSTGAMVGALALWAYVRAVTEDAWS